MRHVHVNLEERQFKADYIKPESIEQAAQNAESFKKDRGPRRAAATEKAPEEKPAAAPAAPEATEESAAESTVEK